MHHRIFISSKNLPASSLSYSIANHTSLNDFARKAMYIGLEWFTPIAASDVNTDLNVDLEYPNGLMLVITNITSYNHSTSWNGSRSILALLPIYVGTGCYGFVVIHPTYKRPYNRSFHTVTTLCLGVLSILTFYPREP